MTEQAISAVRQLIESLVLSGQPLDSAQWMEVSKGIAKLFSVDADEVAVLVLDPRRESLAFIVPEKLAAVGAIPLSSTSALAARTARERKPQLANNFATMRHASVFEGVPLGRNSGDLIQKIMSAPILNAGAVAGVVQISRKGQSPASAGPDFTQKDLQALVSLSPMLERMLQLRAAS